MYASVNKQLANFQLNWALCLSTARERVKRRLRICSVLRGQYVAVEQWV